MMLLFICCSQYQWRYYQHLWMGSW